MTPAVKWKEPYHQESIVGLLCTRYDLADRETQLCSFLPVSWSNKQSLPIIQRQ